MAKTKKAPLSERESGAKQPCFDNEKTENIITTYKERSLHAFLKSYFCPDDKNHEIKIGNFVADACDGTTIYEIQTGNLGTLSKKLSFYLKNTDYNIVVVRPLAQTKRIFWLDDASGELIKPTRPAPQRETIANGISHLFYLREFLGHERLKICFVLMEIDEIRLLDGYGKHKKIRATSVDRAAGEIYSVEYINNLDDLKRAVFPLLPDEPFSRDTLSKSLKLKGLALWSAQKLLVEGGIISCEKQGNKLVFGKVTK